MIKLKKCSVCKIEKPYSDFTPNSGNRSLIGLRSACKPCTKQQQKNHIKRKHEPLKGIEEKLCTQCSDVKPISQFNKNTSQLGGYNSSCKTCQSEKNKHLYVKNGEKVRADANAYYYANKEIIRPKRRAYTNRRVKEDLDFRLKKNLRNRLWYALKNKGWKKNCGFAQYIGCTYDELIIHLESQFTEGMSWENYGGDPKTGWDIDHYIPLSSANIPEEIYKLCHYKNLRPMWAGPNRNEKRDKIPEDVILEDNNKYLKNS